MRNFLLKLKRQAFLYKEIAQMVLNHSKPEEVAPWLNILSAETTYDYTLFWDVLLLPFEADKLWQNMQPDIVREVGYICHKADRLLENVVPEAVTDGEVLAFAELCSELGHLAAYLKVPQLDEQLADMASKQLPLLATAVDAGSVSPSVASLLFASVMQFKGMGIVELKEDNGTSISLN